MSRKQRHDGRAASPDAAREIEELREEIRRAHEAISDLRRALREADNAFGGMKKDIRQVINDIIGEELKKQLAELTPKMRRQIDLTVDRINEKFTHLERMIFGRHAPGDLTLEEAIAKGISNGKISVKERQA